MKNKFLTIENRSGKVKLNDVVHKYSTDDILEEMAKIYGAKAVADQMLIGEVVANSDDALETLEIEINSPGGSVLDGHRIYQELMRMRDRGVRVVATINSLAASMASVIAMAADEIRMIKGGRIMIHDASQSVHGTAKDHLRAAEVLEGMTSEIADIYAARTGQPLDVIRELMANETWLGAEKAKELGFIDAILDGNKVDTSKRVGIMSLFSKPEPDERVEALENQVESLETELETANKDKDEMATASEDAARTIAENAVTIAALIEERDAAIAASEEHAQSIAELSAQIVDLVAKAEVSEEKISLEASRLLAATGQPPVDLEPVGEKPPRDIWEQIAEIKDPVARTKFWKANHQKLTASVRRK